MKKHLVALGVAEGWKTTYLPQGTYHTYYYYILYISRLLGSSEHHLKYHDLGRGICAIGSINSHYFHTIGDGHQPNSRGL